MSEENMDGIAEREATVHIDQVFDAEELERVQSRKSLRRSLVLFHSSMLLTET